MSFWFSRCPVAASSESSSTRSLKTEVPRTRPFTVLFCDFSSSFVSTHDRLPCFAPSLKTVLTNPFAFGSFTLVVTQSNPLPMLGTH